MEKKIKTSFRFPSDVIENIKILQLIYSHRLGLRVSQSDVISMLINNEVNSIDNELFNNFRQKLSNN